MAGGPRVSDALREAERSLRAAGIEAPRVQAFALLGHVVGLDRAALLARLGDTLTDDDGAALAHLVDLRARHHPLQYLIGKAHFLDFDLHVEPGVFIPRPETEQVVQAALALWDRAHRWAVDLCTGSGAIAIALARARPAARVLAVDRSPLALAAAHANAARLGVGERVRFVRSDLLAPLQPATTWPGGAGLLVCNPPYAKRDEVIQPEVRDHEPALAWAAGPTGTEVYESLLPQAAELLPAGRPLVLELGYDQEQAVRALLQCGPWKPPHVEPDFQGIARVLSTARAPDP